MNVRIGAALVTTIVLGSISAGASAQTAASGLVPGGGSAAFRFATSVKTPKGTHSGGGTITIKRTGDRAVSLTIAPDDGKPPHTIPLIVGVDGSVAPDPSGASSLPSGDPNEKAEAQAFMAEMTVAAHVGIGARKSGGGASYTVPVMLTPVGDGTAVSSQLLMNGSAAQYAGRTQGATTTKLPSGGSMDPAEIAKTIGISAVAHRAFTPAGRVATAVAMHHKREEQKEAASGPLPDTVSLTVTADLAAGKIREIRGAQTDAVEIGGKSVAIESSWTFTRI